MKNYTFKTINTVISDNNIAYTHKTCNLMSKQVRTMQGRKHKFEIIDLLILE